jgi:predicted kinase
VETAGAVDVVAHAVRARRRATAGVRLTAVDGLSGSGKSSIARGLARALSAPVIHLDDLYDGWSGLAGIGDRLHEWVVEPLLSGCPPRWRRYDWERGAYAEWHTTPVTADLVLDGCGSGALAVAANIAVLVWVEAPEHLRESRLRARPDWPWYEPHRQGWVRQEQRLHRRERTRGRADAIVENGRQVVVRFTGPPTGVGAVRHGEDIP